jgi:hypothetical protein
MNLWTSAVNTAGAGEAVGVGVGEVTGAIAGVGVGVSVEVMAGAGVTLGARVVVGDAVGVGVALARQVHPGIKTNGKTTMTR